jgi:hypothetical protein
MSNIGNVERLKEKIKQDTVSVFMVHRRVMGDLYKEYGLTGYEIELLLVMIRLANYDVERVVKGIEISNKCGKRFRNVLGRMIDKLCYLGYIEDIGNTGAKAHFRLKITDKAILFSESFFLSLNNRLAEDGISLILNARYSWEKEQGKKKSNE